MARLQTRSSSSGRNRRPVLVAAMDILVALVA
jgi:hypothetical protein